MRKLFSLAMVALLAMTVALAVVGYGQKVAAANVAGVTPPVPLVFNDGVMDWLGHGTSGTTAPGTATGTVTIKVHITREGRVDRVLENSATRDLKGLIEQAAREWRFKPATRDGRPIDCTSTIVRTYQVTSTYTVTLN